MSSQQKLNDLRDLVTNLGGGELTSQAKNYRLC